MSDECFHLVSSCIDLIGKLVVAQGTIKAVTEISLSVELAGEIVIAPIDCTELP